jgi:hypothetical protein
VKGTLDYSNYIEWIHNVALSLQDQNEHPNALLDRYAIPIDVPDDPSPRHVLLDIRDLLEAGVYEHWETKEPLDIEDLSNDVDSDTFTVRANGTDYEVKIRFNSQRQRYQFASDMLNNAYRPTPGHLDRYQRGLVSYLNVSQAFRVVPNAKWTIYAHSKFYRPRRSFGRSDAERRLELLNIFSPVEALRNVDSEKGSNGSATPDGWPESSVFHVIDSHGRNPEEHNDALASALKGMDILVCDDIQNEVADFIAASTVDQRVVLLHAKAGSQRLSASAFQDVCGQVVKNLESLIPYYDYRPPNLGRWEQPWVRRKGDDYVEYRIRKGRGPAKDLWETIRDITLNPTSTREVWIVYGKGFSLRFFEEQVGRNDPVPEAVNLVYLLQSTWAAVASIGARFRIFCLEEDG